MPIRRSEAPDPKKFVREQIEHHVGHDVDDLDGNTMISGTVAWSMMDELGRQIQPLESFNMSSIRLDQSYTVDHCIRMVRAAISNHCIS